MAPAPIIDLALVGIGAGNPEHITLQAIRALNRADVVLLPRKGPEKAELAEVRRSIFAAVVTNPATRIVEFDLPVRDSAAASYRTGVEDWHAAIVGVWRRALTEALPDGGRAALMVWGDPSLYDSTLRIAARLGDILRVSVIPGVTALQALTAAFGIALNEIGAPVLVTTGRNLREGGWPQGVDTVAVLLDGSCAFTALAPAGVSIWWGANLGASEEALISGELASVSDRIVETRAALRKRSGWVMDIYLLRRSSRAAGQA